MIKIDPNTDYGFLRISNELEDHKPAANPSMLPVPVFLMNIPFSFSAMISNNQCMQELQEQERKVSFPKAFQQFFSLYQFLSSQAIVHLLPSSPDMALQDLVFVANLGIVLDHLANKDTVILSKFFADGRHGESEFSQDFFYKAGYNTIISPFYFEGEADLKHLHDNVYIGAYGLRSEKKAFEWMENNFDMKIIKVEAKNPYLFHLDGSAFPITKAKTIVCTDLYTKDEISEIEKETEIISVSYDEAFYGIANSIRVNGFILNSTFHHLIPKTHCDYEKLVHKNRRLADIANALGMEAHFFDISEFFKGGAELSCLVMHLNRNSYLIDYIKEVSLNHG